MGFWRGIKVSKWFFFLLKEELNQFAEPNQPGNVSGAVTRTVRTLWCARWRCWACSSQREEESSQQPCRFQWGDRGNTAAGMEMDSPSSDVHKKSPDVQCVMEQCYNCIPQEVTLICLMGSTAPKTLTLGIWIRQAHFYHISRNYIVSVVLK